MNRPNWNELYESGRDYKIMNLRLLRKILDDQKLEKGAKVLDFGCGTGDLARKLAQNDLQVMAVDPSSSAINIAKQRSSEFAINFEQIGSNELKQLSASAPFDAIFVKLVIAFVDDLEALFDNLKKLLKAGGSIVIISPVSFEDETDERYRQISVDYDLVSRLLGNLFGSVVELNRDFTHERGEEITFVAKP